MLDLFGAINLFQFAIYVALIFHIDLNLLDNIGIEIRAPPRKSFVSHFRSPQSLRKRGAIDEGVSQPRNLPLNFDRYLSGPVGHVLWNNSKLITMIDEA